ncbi:hypothetical protein B0A49_09550 [Cryomyces minteri]|uniref:Peptidase S26 domain-containing protein n=2 Tax=Cryomyces TaxID=329878 RepID=A0A4U0WZ41_9PEZI|nr:hypothetical protein B0A49_09550 [Cryomyces minteri]
MIWRSFAQLREYIRASPKLSYWTKVAEYTVGGSLLGHVFVNYAYSISPIWGYSMIPTLAASGDSVVISKHFRRGRDVEVGDIVSFLHPVKDGEYAMKRVLGMPGDFVLRDTPGKGEGTMVQVPEGHCWVVGDNLFHSRDSRMFGPLPLALIRGKAVARAWPKPGWIQNGLKAPYEDNDEDEEVEDND